MRRRSKSTQWRRPCLGAATLFLAMLATFSGGWAQDGVAGGAPIFSGSKKPTPGEEKLPDPTSKIKVQSPLVTTPVTVVDRSGGYVYDLEEKDFRILDNGVAQDIESLKQESRPLAAVIMIETNSKVAPLLDHVRPLGSIFSALVLGEQGEAAVMFFDDRVRVAQEFSSDSDRLAKTLRDAGGRGDEARLNDALSRAISMLETRPKEERRVIIAFSDGYDSGSETTKEEIIRRATTDEISIYGLGFSPAQALLEKKPHALPQSPLDTNITRPLPPGSVATPDNSERTYGMPVPAVPIMIASGEMIRSAVASSLLEFYAGYTGGVFYSHWSQKALQEQLGKVATEIHSQYELAYVPTTREQGGFHRIKVEVQRSGVKVRTRAGYFYPETRP